MNKITRKDFAKRFGTGVIFTILGTFLFKKNTYAMISDNLSVNSETDNRYPVGSVINSTICSTMEQVIKAYGGKKWIQHSGYILRGATSGVKTNRASKDGGEDTHKLTISEMPSHTHVQNAHDHTQYGISNGSLSGAAPHIAIQGDGNTVVYYSNGISPTGLGNTAGRGTEGDIRIGGGQTRAVSAKVATNQNTGGSAAHNNMQSYKNVYIWERVE